MALTLWEPVVHNGERRMLAALDRLLSDRLMSPAHDAPMDVIETDNDVIIRMSVPGTSKEAVDVTFKQQVLTIKAEVPADVKEEGSRYLLKERFHGKVERSIQLPWEVNVDEATAEYKDGVLTLTLPKAETARPKTIEIK